MRGPVLLIALLGSAAGHPAPPPAARSRALGLEPPLALFAPALAPSPYEPELAPDPFALGPLAPGVAPHPRPASVPLAPAELAPAALAPIALAPIALAPSPYELALVPDPYARQPSQPLTGSVRIAAAARPLAIAPSPYERPSARELAPIPY